MSYCADCGLPIAEVPCPCICQPTPTLVPLDAVVAVIESMPIPRVNFSTEMADGYDIALTQAVQRLRDHFVPPASPEGEERA